MRWCHVSAGRKRAGRACAEAEGWRSAQASREERESAKASAKARHTRESASRESGWKGHAERQAVRAGSDSSKRDSRAPSATRIQPSGGAGTMAAERQGRTSERRLACLSSPLGVAVERAELHESSGQDALTRGWAAGRAHVRVPGGRGLLVVAVIEQRIQVLVVPLRWPARGRVRARVSARAGSLASTREQRSAARASPRDGGGSRGGGDGATAVAPRSHGIAGGARSCHAHLRVVHHRQPHAQCLLPAAALYRDVVSGGRVVDVSPRAFPRTII